MHDFNFLLGCRHSITNTIMHLSVGKVWGPIIIQQDVSVNETSMTGHENSKQLVINMSQVAGCMLGIIIQTL